MDIYLWDLGRKRQAALLQWRATFNSSQYSERQIGVQIGALPMVMPPKPRRLGLMGRMWARGAGSPPDVVGDAIGVMRGQIYGMMGGLVGGSLGFWVPAVGASLSGEPTIGLIIATFAATISGIGLWVPGYWLKRVCRPPVLSAEVEALKAAVSDELEQTYLRLCGDVVRLSVAPEASDRVRAALRAVGETIDYLPAVAVPRAGAEAMRDEEAQARAEARAEADPVVAASHERRADALGRSADGVQRSQILTRRASALREEMTAQIESLRLGLAGLESASGDVAGLAALADAVRSVATEAFSVVDARAELDAALAGAHSTEVALQARVG